MGKVRKYKIKEQRKKSEEAKIIPVYEKKDSSKYLGEVRIHSYIFFKPWSSRIPYELELWISPEGVDDSYFYEQYVFGNGKFRRIRKDVFIPWWVPFGKEEKFEKEVMKIYRKHRKKIFEKATSKIKKMR